MSGLGKFFRGILRLHRSSTKWKAVWRIPPAGNPALVKYVGNVPASGKPPAGVLRHRGWRATTASLPQLNTREDLAILAPAEIEVE